MILTFNVCFHWEIMARRQLNETHVWIAGRVEMELNIKLDTIANVNK